MPKWTSQVHLCCSLPSFLYDPLWKTASQTQYPTVSWVYGMAVNRERDERERERLRFSW